MKHKHKTQRITRRRQGQNLKQAQKAFKQWQAQHLKRCEDFNAGPCCCGCHATDGLYLLDLDNGDIAYVCCLKRIENKLGLRDEGMALMQVRNHHAVTPKRWEPEYETEAGKALPPGLLRTYLEGLLK